MLASCLYIHELLKKNQSLKSVTCRSNKWIVESNTDKVSLFSPENGCTCILSWSEMESAKANPNGPVALIIGRLMSIQIQLPLPQQRLVVMPVLGEGCGGNCRYCFIPPGNSRRGLLDITDVIRFVESEYKAGEVHIDFSGNLSRYQYEIISISKHLKSLIGENVSFSVQTTGGDINNETAHCLGQQGFSFGVSFDGTPTLHEFHRRQSSDHTIRLLRLLLDSGYPHLVRCTISRRSIQNIDSMLAYMENLGIRSIILNKLRPPAVASTLEIPSESEWLGFYEDWFNYALAHKFPDLCDDTALKWLHRLGSSPMGWSNLCSTRWCELNCRIRILTMTNEILQCARYWTKFPSQESGPSYPIDCSACFCRYHCGGGCRIERLHPAEHTVMCAQKRWIVSRLLRAILILPESELVQFGFEEVPQALFTMASGTQSPVFPHRG